ncbi:hypothetical protein C0J52_15215 [Blattella germanica]|nr:hypothetical protein C0J52_15215 [Blattella germanica]
MQDIQEWKATQNREKKGEKSPTPVMRWFRFVAMFTSNELLELMEIMRVFQEIFNKAPPREATLLDWERRAFSLAGLKTGCGVEGRRHEKKHALESLLR